MDDEMIDDRPARPTRSRLRRYVGLAAGAVALLVLGVAGGILWSERHGGGARARRAAPARDAQTPAASPRGGSMAGVPGMSAPAGQAAAGQRGGGLADLLTAGGHESARGREARGQRQTNPSGA